MESQIKNRYIKLYKAPGKHDKAVKVVSMLMAEPFAFSQRFREYNRRKEIKKYKLENSKFISILEKLESKRAEIVNTTPFNNFDDNLALKLIDQRLTEL